MDTTRLDAQARKHHNGYRGFLTLMKLSTAGAAAVLILLALVFLN